MNFMYLIYAMVAIVPIIFLFGMRVIRPTHRGLVERFGKYHHFAEPGLTIIIPMIDRLILVNVTEQMVDAESQEIITSDNLNAVVDAQIYFKVKTTEESVKFSQYGVNDYEYQIVNLARTTLRNIIGTLSLKDCNNKRNSINEMLQTTLEKETSTWGIAIVRAELKEIKPPEDVQETMNKVVKANNEKEAAVDFATATETKADGERRAQIKIAEGYKQAKILQAQGEAESIKLVNESAEKYFKGPAKELKKLEVLQNCLAKNSKVIITQDGITPQLLIGSLMAGKEE